MRCKKKKGVKYVKKRMQHRAKLRVEEEGIRVASKSVIIRRGNT